MIMTDRLAHAIRAKHRTRVSGVRHVQRVAADHRRAGCRPRLVARRHKVVVRLVEAVAQRRANVARRVLRSAYHRLVQLLHRILGARLATMAVVHASEQVARLQLAYNQPVLHVATVTLEFVRPHTELVRLTLCRRVRFLACRRLRSALLSDLSCLCLARRISLCLFLCFDLRRLLFLALRFCRLLGFLRRIGRRPFCPWRAIRSLGVALVISAGSSSELSLLSLAEGCILSRRWLSGSSCRFGNRHGSGLRFGNCHGAGDRGGLRHGHNSGAGAWPTGCGSHPCHSRRRSHPRHCRCSGHCRGWHFHGCCSGRGDRCRPRRHRAGCCCCRRCHCSHADCWLRGGGHCNRRSGDGCGRPGSRTGNSHGSSRSGGCRRCNGRRPRDNCPRCVAHKNRADVQDRTHPSRRQGTYSVARTSRTAHV